MRTRLAQLIEYEEGFGVPGMIPNDQAESWRPSPHAQHPGEPNDVGTIDTDERGREDLERQILLDADRGLTLRQFVYKFSPPTENDSARYLRDVCAGLGLGPDTPLKEATVILA